MSDTPETPEPLLARLYEFRDRSRTLSILAKKGDWGAFEKALAERESGLAALNENQFLIDIARAGLENEAKECLAEIQALNDEIVILAEKGKADINRQLKDSQKAQKGIKEYQEGKS